MPKKSIDLRTWGAAGDAISGKSAFKRGEILFGKLRPYFHKVGVAQCDGVCSTDVLIVTASMTQYFGVVVGHLSSVELIDWTDAASTGTRMPRTSWKDIARYSIALPAPVLCDATSKRYSEIVQCMSANNEESRTLGALRDTLLPKLMSGEIRLGQAEKLVGDSL